MTVFVLILQLIYLVETLLPASAYTNYVLRGVFEDHEETKKQNVLLFCLFTFYVSMLVSVDSVMLFQILEWVVMLQLIKLQKNKHYTDIL